MYATTQPPGSPGSFNRRVVITGLGVIAPNGNGKEAFWQACLAGRSGLRRVTRFNADTLSAQVAGEVAQFDPTDYALTPDEMRSLDRASQFALASAYLALHDAGIAPTPIASSPLTASPETPTPTTSLQPLSEEQREHCGVTVGLALACLEAGERAWAQAYHMGRKDAIVEELDPVALLLSHAAASSIAAHHQFYGPCSTIATGCSSGADAIGQAFWDIQEGRADKMLAGGTDAAISYGVMDAFCVTGALSTHFNADPTRASRPYDKERDGFVMAEGAGMLLLEEREQALARGAHIYAEIVAFASNSNAHHMTALPPDGQPLQALLQQVLVEAELAPHAVDYINAHGSSTRPNEIAETTAYKAVFGERAYHIPINATKSMIGHTQGAASAIETIVTALVLDRQQIPPTINQEYDDPHCDLDYVPNQARTADIQVAVTHSSGFGGVNSALVLTRTEKA